jgi:energy-coupling factor transporter ATP-binding protein EcfA2
MAFEDTGWLELRPITLLFGRNSSGKSVIIRALRLLKQSLLYAPTDSPFAYSVEDGVDVGSFLDMAHGQDKKQYQYRTTRREEGTEYRYIYPEKTIQFGFRCVVPSSKLAHLLEGNIPAEDESWLELSLSFIWNEILACVELASLHIEAPWSAFAHQERKTVFGAEREYSLYLDADLQNWYFWSDFIYEDYDVASTWPVTTIQFQKGFLPTMEIYWDNVQYKYEQRRDLLWLKDIIETLSSSISEYLEKLEYSPPIRPDPYRFYLLENAQIRHMQLQGLGAFLRLISNQLPPSEIDRINYWLRRLNLADNIEIIQRYEIPDRVMITELKLDEGDNGNHEVTLSDMGYGISQVLPIVLQSLLATSDSMILIEQPELHLHPEVQARLADFFIKMAEEGKHYMIETHSEHVLLRLQRRIVETKYDELVSKEKAGPRNNGFNLSTNDLNIIYIHRKGILSQIEVVKTDHYGELVSPSDDFLDFFKRDYEDVVCQDQTIAELVKMGK